MSVTTEPAVVENVSRPAAVSQRLMSVDALRGFDMFWIIGADSLVYALNRMSKSGPTDFLATQLEHTEWAGFHFYDLIFPLFVFIVGVSLVFSLSKTLESEGRVAALTRVFRRSVLLFIVGLFYSGGFTNPWPDMRLMGVLNRIALAYFFAGLLFCFFKPRTLAIICATLLVGYWATMTFVPIRDVQLTKSALAPLAEKRGSSESGALILQGGNPSTSTNRAAWVAAESLFYLTTERVSGKFDPGYNLSDHLDFQYLPGKKYDNFYDPEGLLSTVPAVATCLLGAFAGLLLRSQSVPDRRKLAWLVTGGLIAVGLGWAWNLQFPVIKKIWTSSFVLVAGGYSALLLAVFYCIVDVFKIRFWCRPFVWMGMNSITIYLASNILGGGGFRRIAPRFAGGDIRAWFDANFTQGFGDLVISIVGLALAFWFVRFLYQRKIFLRF